MFLFVKVAIDGGVKKIRITGGEPLVRKGIEDFIKMIVDYAPGIDLALTTNGYYLKNYARALKDAGLKRINMSLDSLRPERATPPAALVIRGPTHSAARPACPARFAASALASVRIWSVSMFFSMVLHRAMTYSYPEDDGR